MTPPRRLVVVGAVVITYASVASSQQILPSAASSSFPACGLSCTVLVDAQSTCQSSYSSGTAALVYENCFCTQSSVQELYASADDLCTTECTSESDRTLLQTWFTSFCKLVGEGINPNTVSSTATSTTATTTGTSAASSTTAASTASTTSSGIAYTDSLNDGQDYTGPWINSHWRWLVMVGVLIVGLSLFAWLAVWLKNRHRRQAEHQRISMTGFPSPTEKKDRPSSAVAATDMWGPHQHMHATNGWQYQPDQANAVAAADALKPPDTLRSKRDSGRSGRSARSTPSTRSMLGTVVNAEDTPPPPPPSRNVVKGKRREATDYERSSF